MKVIPLIADSCSKYDFLDLLIEHLDNKIAQEEYSKVAAEYPKNVVRML